MSIGTRSSTMIETSCGYLLQELQARALLLLLDEENGLSMIVILNLFFPLNYNLTDDLE